PVNTPFRSNAARAPGEVGYTTPDPKSQSAEAVAEMTLRAVERDAPVVETSAFVRMAGATSRLAPPVLRMALRRLAKRPLCRSVPLLTPGSGGVDGARVRRGGRRGSRSRRSGRRGVRGRRGVGGRTHRRPRPRPWLRP